MTAGIHKGRTAERELEAVAKLLRDAELLNSRGMGVIEGMLGTLADRLDSVREELQR